MKTNNIKIGSLEVGGDKFCFIAGPCSIESKEHLSNTLDHVIKNGANVLRGGIYKLRTENGSFQGLGDQAYQFVANLKNEKSIPFITEVTDPRQISDMMDVADIFQVGSRNMYNYALLKELGKVDKPVMLKRGFSATVHEWVNAAKYIEDGGNKRVILCERGIRGFDDVTRNILDLGTVAHLKQNYHYPVIVDPSHGTGVRDLVEPMALAAIAAGADGIIIETHPKPDEAMSDGFQSLDFDQLEKLSKKIKAILPMFGKSL
ncbi:MAG: 3-deoxy-7-phosphoheptulonate synthase [Bdellovibrionales bacterium]